MSPYPPEALPSCLAQSTMLFAQPRASNPYFPCSLDYFVNVKLEQREGHLLVFALGLAVVPNGDGKPELIACQGNDGRGQSDLLATIPNLGRRPYGLFLEPFLDRGNLDLIGLIFLISCHDVFYGSWLDRVGVTSPIFAHDKSSTRWRT